MSAAFGTGNGTTSYGENIGAISVTKVARGGCPVRRVRHAHHGLFPSSAPSSRPCPHRLSPGHSCLFGLIAASGLLLDRCDLQSSRNLFIIGFCFTMAWPSRRRRSYFANVPPTPWRRRSVLRLLQHHAIISLLSCDPRQLSPARASARLLGDRCHRQRRHSERLRPPVVLFQGLQELRYPTSRTASSGLRSLPTAT